MLWSKYYYSGIKTILKWKTHIINEIQRDSMALFCSYIGIKQLECIYDYLLLTDFLIFNPSTSNNLLRASLSLVKFYLHIFNSCILNVC